MFARFRGSVSLMLTIVLISSLISFAGFKPHQAEASSNYTLVTLKSSNNGKYVTVTTSNSNRIESSSATATANEQKFALMDWGDGTFSLRALSNGLYVTASGKNNLIANASVITSTEKFSKVKNADDTYSILSLSNSKYLSVSATSAYVITASSDTIANTQQKFVLSDASPSSAKQEIRVLEITDSGTSELLPLLGTSNDPVFKIDSVRMKQFVAMRDELDGKYDAIYIGQGLYNATLVGTDQNHNTTAIMNDITSLKFNQIKDYYINRGLPVIVYSEATTASNTTGALYQNKAGILKAGFTPYANINSSPKYPYVPTSNTSNVIFVGSTIMASTSAFLTATDLKNRAAARPRLQVTSKPIDYTENSNNKYVAGDILTYKFDLANVADISQRSLVANLYIGIDNVLKFTTDQLIATQPVTSLTNNTLTFRLPKGYSGVHYWKLELVDQGSKMRDIQTGVLRFHDQVTKINVLQILPTSGDASSLTKESNMKQSYLTSDDYQITIKTMSITDFNSTGYKNLNGYYDMLIFGFADSYNSSAPISKTAADAVNAYIGTGQSVMFTHDTVFQGSSNWISYFQQATGQVDPMTNMGLSAPQTSKTTSKVNEGLLTRFPFNISNATTEVNTTHDQYFGLKLEDEKLIPWYNITGGTRDNDDSWNHYYTYSYGNVTYSGTGHTNTAFPDWEQRLFVNTMYRAFIGSNHAPLLTVDSPTNTADTGKIIPSYNDILVSYTPQDYDLIDRTLSTAVSFKYRKLSTDAWSDLKQVKPYTDSRTGDVITESYPNPLPDGGDLMIYISAKDKSGALVTQGITTKVVKVTANIDLTRTLSNNVVNNQIEKNVPFTMTYTLTPKTIPYQNGINPDDLIIKNFKLDEILPPNLELLASDTSPVLLQPTLTGSLTAGYHLKGSLADIQYRLSPDGKSFIADPVTFTIKVTPKQNGNYLINDSNLGFTDFYVNGATVTKDIARTLQFQAYAIQAVTKMTSLSLSDTLIAKDDTSKLIPVIGPTDTSNPVLTWSSDHPEIVTVDATGTIKGIAEGKAKITATATDGSGLTAVANVTVVIPGLNIVGPSTVNVDDVINLEARLILANETAQSITWTFGPGQASKAELGNTTSDLQKTLTGINAGQVDITVTAVTNKAKTYSKTFTVTVLQPISLTLPSEIHIGRGTEWKRDLWGTALTVTPASSRTAIQSYTTWASSSSTVASIGTNNGVAVGVSSGSSNITVQYQKNPKSDPVQAQTTLVVVDLNAPNQINVGKGKTLNLKDLVTAAPANVSSNVLSRLTWSDESDKNFATVSSNGMITGSNAGVENVTITYRQTDGGPVVTSRVVQVNVLDITGPAAVAVAKDSTLNLKDLITAQPSSLSNSMLDHLTWSRETGKDNVTVDANGIATGKTAGVQNITAEYRETTNGPVIASWTIKVTVVDLNVPAQITIKNGSTLDLKGRTTMTPADLKDALTWKVVTNNGIASVSSAGIVEGKKPGTENLIVSYTPADSTTTITKTIKVNVIDLGLPASAEVVTGLTLDLNTLLSITPSTLSSEVKNHLTWQDDTSKNALSVSSSGIATGNRVGTENVTVVYQPSDGSPAIQAVVTVTVTPVNLTLPASLTLDLSKSADLMDKLGITPIAWKQEIVKQLEWSEQAGNDSVTLGTNGHITASSAGSEIIQAIYRNPLTHAEDANAAIKVNVVQIVLPGSITIGQDVTHSLFDDLIVNADPAAKKDILDNISWTDETGKSIVSVDDRGNVTGDNPGKETITGTYHPADGDAIQVKVEVTVKAIYLGEPTSLTLKRGTTYDFMTRDEILSSQPDYVKSKLTWTITNNASTVSSNGKLVASTSGIATVKVAYRKTATSPEISRIFTIKIVDMYLPSSITLTVGEQYKLLQDSGKGKLTILPSTLESEIKAQLIWSDDPAKNIAAVNSLGVVTAVAAGNEIITVKYQPANSDAITAQVTVTVLAATKHNSGGDKY